MYLLQNFSTYSRGNVLLHTTFCTMWSCSFCLVYPLLLLSPQECTLGCLLIEIHLSSCNFVRFPLVTWLRVTPPSSEIVLSIVLVVLIPSIMLSLLDLYFIHSFNIYIYICKSCLLLFY